MDADEFIGTLFQGLHAIGFRFVMIEQPPPPPLTIHSLNPLSPELCAIADALDHPGDRDLPLFQARTFEG